MTSEDILPALISACGYSYKVLGPPLHLTDFVSHTRHANTEIKDEEPLSPSRALPFTKYDSSQEDYATQV
jgi:hypothetical protein